MIDVFATRAGKTAADLGRPAVSENAAINVNMEYGVQLTKKAPVKLNDS